MKPRYLVALLAGIGILAIIVVAMTRLLASMPAETTGPALRVGIAIVLTFLILLVLRYFALLWLGYLQHLESNISPPGDAAFQPPVTIIVPAYNEGAVIATAIRSLLDLGLIKA